ncbi:MAG: hypothetical protein MK010_03275 [Erythrobacter sp.]|nr:hypothetical protein [Erythrobacter sp.]
MSDLVSARLVPLNALLLRAAEVHGRRLDRAAAVRQVREAASLTWVPDGITGDPLALVERLEEHVAGAFRPKGGTTIAQHMIVKMPDSIPTETESDAYFAMLVAVGFAQEAFGGQAVFAARIDRDEKSTNNVDLFLAPIYDKNDKKAPGGSKKAVSMTRHLKLLAEEHGFDVKGARSAKASKQSQGKALQTAFADYLVHHGFRALRGKPKTASGSDWDSPEVYGAKRDREAAEKGLQLLQDELHNHIKRSENVASRERGLDDRETLILSNERNIAGRIAEVRRQETLARDHEIRLDNRDTTIRTKEDWIREREIDLNTRAAEVEADRKVAATDRSKADAELEQAKEAVRKADEARVLQQHALKAAKDREKIAANKIARNMARERELETAQDRIKRKENEATEALAEAERERQAAQQERSRARELLSELLKITEPIRDMVKRVTAAIGLDRKALLAQGGAEAVEAASSPEMQRVFALGKANGISDEGVDRFTEFSNLQDRGRDR